MPILTIRPLASGMHVWKIDPNVPEWGKRYCFARFPPNGTRLSNKPSALPSPPEAASWVICGFAHRFGKVSMKLRQGLVEQTVTWWWTLFEMR